MDFAADKNTLEILGSLEETRKDYWNIPRNTGILLNTFIKMMNAKNVLEIGTSNGYSGIWLAKALKETGGILTTIEFYEKRQKIALENFKICGVIDIVRPIQGSACEIIESFDKNEKFDFIFIDASKREYVKYFELLKPHMTQKVMIAADNIISHSAKVQSFIEAVDNDEDFQYTILEVPGGLLTAYRN